MLAARHLPTRQVFGCFPKRAGDYRLKRFNGASWIETSAKAYNAYSNTWKIVNGYVFDNGVKQNFYGALVDDMVWRLENRGITMKPGISTWDDVFSDVTMLSQVLKNDDSVTALLDDDALRNKAKGDSRILSAIKNYGTYGRAALLHIKNNDTLKNEFLAISGAYSDRTDFRYLLTCEGCNSTGSQYTYCKTCGGLAYIEGYGIYFRCNACTFFGDHPEGYDHCSCGNSIANGNYTSYDVCPTCNPNGNIGFWRGEKYSVVCSDCDGKGCHF